MPYPFINIIPTGSNVLTPGTLLDLPRDPYTGTFLAEPSDARKGSFVPDPFPREAGWTGQRNPLQFTFSGGGTVASKWTIDFNMLTIIPYEGGPFIEFEGTGLQIQPSPGGLFVSYRVSNGGGSLYYAAFVQLDIYPGNYNVHFRVTFDNGLRIYVNGEEKSKANLNADTGYKKINGVSSTISQVNRMNITGQKLEIGNSYGNRFINPVHAFRYYPNVAIVPAAPSYDDTSGAFIPQGQWDMSGVGSQGLQIQSNAAWNGSTWSQNVNAIANLSFGFSNNNAGRHGFTYGGPNDTYLFPTTIYGGGEHNYGGLGHFAWTSSITGVKDFQVTSNTACGIPGSRQKKSGKIYFEIGLKGSRSADLITTWDLVGSNPSRKVLRLRSRTAISENGWVTATDLITGITGVVLDYDDLSVSLYNQGGTLIERIENVIQPYPMSLRMYSPSGYVINWGDTQPVDTFTFVNLGQYPFEIFDHEVKGYELCSTAYRKNDFAIFNADTEVGSAVYHDAPATGMITLDGLDKDILFMNSQDPAYKSIIMLKKLGTKSFFCLGNWGGLESSALDLVNFNFVSLDVNMSAWAGGGEVNVNGVNVNPYTGFQIVEWTGDGAEGEVYHDIETEYPPTAAIILPHHSSQAPYLVIYNEEDNNHHAYDMRGSRLLTTPIIDFFKVRSGLTSKVSTITHVDPSVPNVNVAGVDYTAIIISEAPGVTDIAYYKKRSLYEEISPTQVRDAHRGTTVPSFGLIKHFGETIKSGHDYYFWVPNTTFFVQSDASSISRNNQCTVTAWAPSVGPLDVAYNTEPMFSNSSRLFGPVQVKQGLIIDQADYRGDGITKGFDRAGTTYGFSLMVGKSSLYTGRQSSAPRLPTVIVVTDATFIPAIAAWSNGLLTDTQIIEMDTSRVTDMSNMLSRSNAIGGSNGILSTMNLDISGWDTSRVTDMSNMFSSMVLFNQDISGWDTSKVTSMQGMFHNAEKFNRSLSSWNTSSVTTMAGMFEQATEFNSDIGTWDTSNVTSMAYMFFSATAFNGTINTWDVGNVVNFTSMFRSTQSYNQSLSSWDTSSAIDMSHMFNSARQFNQNISGWNVTNVTNMDNMFNAAAQFNQDLYFWCVVNIPSLPTGFSTGAHSLFTGEKLPPWGTCPVPITITSNADLWQALADWSNGIITDGVISHIDISAVTSLNNIRNNSISAGGDAAVLRDFNVDISFWDTSNVTDFGFAFFEMRRFNQPIGVWDLSSANAVNGMFMNATDFNQSLSSWDTSAVTTMENMFNGALNFNNAITSWDVSKVRNVRYMFYKAGVFNQNLSSWTLSIPFGMNEEYASFTPAWNTPAFAPTFNYF